MEKNLKSYDYVRCMLFIKLINLCYLELVVVKILQKLKG